MVKLNEKMGLIAPQNMFTAARLASLGAKQDCVRLDYNENRFGACPQIARAISGIDPCSYPEYRSSSLVKAIAARHGVYEEQVYVSSGSDAILDGIPLVFGCDSHAQVIIPGLTYERFEKACRLTGAKIVSVPLLNYEIDLGATLSEINEHTKVIYLVNPNMPTGTVKSSVEIKDFLDKVPSSVLVVLDQAYADYVEDPRAMLNETALLKRHNNLLILRTFSKYFGLAAFRIGYFFASDARFVDGFNRAFQPLPVSHHAIVAALTALQNQEWYTQNVYVPTAKSKEFFIDGMRELNLPVLRSHGNFVFVDTQELGWDNQDVQKHLLRRKAISIRPIRDLGIRVTIGQKKDMAALLDGFKEYAAAHGVRR